MTKTIEHVVKADGLFYRRETSEAEIDPGPAFEKAFAKQMPVKLPNVLDIPGYGRSGMYYNPADNATYWSIPVPFINLRCEFRTLESDGEKILVPKFIYPEGSQEVIIIKWELTHDLGLATPRIILMVKIKQDGGDYYAEQQWLFAFDARNNVYQLPTANLYDHLALCTGKFDSYRVTQLEVIQAAIAQFETSPWNDHLYHDGREAQTASFFRFKPTKDGFETLPINHNDWTKLCQKRSVAFTEYVV